MLKNTPERICPVSSVTFRHNSKCDAIIQDLFRISFHPPAIRLISSINIKSNSFLKSELLFYSRK